MGSLEVVFPLGVLGEPSSLDASLLLEDFLDAPEAGKSEYSRERRPEHTWDKNSGYGTRHTRYEKDPPASCAEMVFSLDDDGVEDADNQESADADE